MWIHKQYQKKNKELTFQDHKQSKFNWEDSEVINFLRECHGNEKKEEKCKIFYVSYVGEILCLYKHLKIPLKS